MSVNEVTKKKGRSSLYSEELADLICERMAIHPWGLEKLCAHYKDLPDKTTINRWRVKHREFREKFAEAKSSQIETLVDEIIDISDDSSRDTMTNELGAIVSNNAAITRDKLRIDSRKWLAAKLLPKVYGNKDDSFVNLKFPTDLKNADALLPIAQEIFRGLGSQEITVSQAKNLLGTLKDYSSSLVIIDLNHRMNALLENKNTNSDTIEGEQNV